MPHETLDCLLNLEIPVQYLRGNGETAVLAELAGKTPLVPPKSREVIRWNAQQLKDRDKEFLAGWPLTRRLEISGLGQVLFCHATPRDDNEVFTRLTPEDGLLPIFDLDADVVVCGHTHMQFDRMIGTTRVVNAGSVGMPFAAPGAYWLLLGTTVTLQNTPYELVMAAERIRSTNYPQARDFAANHVLQPPSEKEMLEVFAHTEVGRS